MTFRKSDNFELLCRNWMVPKTKGESIINERLVNQP